MRRRLFEGFEERVEGVAREHVHLVDEVHLVTPPCRRVENVLQQFARILDLGARRRVDFQQIDKTAVGDLPASAAHPTGCRGDALLAVEAFGNEPGERGLAHAAGARQQVGMMEPIAAQRVDQGTQHVLLPDHLFEGLRTPTAREYLVTHGVGTGSGWRHDLMGWRRPRPAAPRHTHRQLPLLPSGPGGVCCLALRGDRPGPP